MPEACFLCLDSTEYMRNGDQFPTRLMAEVEAATLLVNAKAQMNAENTIGFLTMGGSACTVYESLTMDVDSVMAAMTRIAPRGTVCHFTSGLLIASLALSHRTNPRAEKRIVAMVGSPLKETEKELGVLAKKLRKDDVAVDVVSFGAESNVSLLEGFVEKVNKQDNSRFLHVPEGENLTNVLISNAILLGHDTDMSGEGGIGASAFPFGVDPSLDPELAMALRMSMEEEMQRQQAAAAAAGGGGEGAGGEGVAPEAPATAAPAPEAPTAVQQTPPPPDSSNAEGAAPFSENEEDDDDDFANMSEEEMLQRAIAMSLQGATASQKEKEKQDKDAGPSDEASEAK